jgi:hypothetical protein
MVITTCHRMGEEGAEPESCMYIIQGQTAGIKYDSCDMFRPNERSGLKVLQELLRLGGPLQNYRHLYFCKEMPQTLVHSFMRLAYLTSPPPPIYTAEIVTKWVCVGGAIQKGCGY